MVNRVAATVLWFYTGATATNAAVLAWGLPSFLTVLVGVATAAFVLVDPAHVIWTRRTAEPAA